MGHQALLSLTSMNPGFYIVRPVAGWPQQRACLKILGAVCVLRKTTIPVLAGAAARTHFCMGDRMAKIQKAFSTTTAHSAYGRDAEKAHIAGFLAGPEHVLHITGKPGTGKTCTVLGVLSASDHLYINYYYTPHISKALRASSARTVVIDEFDKYFKEKKTQCMRDIIELGRRKAKLITISNNLKMGKLKFGPYSTQDIIQILQRKMDEEIGEPCIERPALVYIAKKYSQHGDLRIVFKVLLDLFFKKASGGGDTLALQDCLAGAGEQGAQGMHHQIVSRIAAGGEARADAYQAFIKECQAMRLPVFDRQDFFMIYEMYTL
ncbi:hypothetical protein PAPHI01_0887 [Pancytospora philotis]|nr:hypothetical protein PAPHI01_0887 [Pancytospora philotis]